MNRNKAERKKNFIRIGAMIVAAIMTLSIVLAMVIR